MQLAYCREGHDCRPAGGADPTGVALPSSGMKVLPPQARPNGTYSLVVPGINRLPMTAQDNFRVNYIKSGSARVGRRPRRSTYEFAGWEL